MCLVPYTYSGTKHIKHVLCRGSTDFQEDEDPPQGFELHQSKDVRVERVEGMTLELDVGAGEDGEGGKDVLVTSNATQKITEVGVTEHIAQHDTLGGIDSSGTS